MRSIGKVVFNKGKSILNPKKITKFFHSSYAEQFDHYLLCQKAKLDNEAEYFLLLLSAGALRDEVFLLKLTHF